MSENNRRDFHVYEELMEFIGILENVSKIMDDTYHVLPHKYARFWKDIKDQSSYLLAQMHDEREEVEKRLHSALGFGVDEMPF